MDDKENQSLSDNGGADAITREEAPRAFEGLSIEETEALGKKCESDQLQA